MGKKLTRREYQKYLQSSHWKDIRRRYRESKLFDGQCYACSSTERLQLHHKSYNRLGRERLTDLIYLCDECHSIIHHILRIRASGKTNLWNVARKLRKMIGKRGKEDAFEWARQTYLHSSTVPPARGNCALPPTSTNDSLFCRQWEAR